ncbi:MAG: response regulator, partial [Mixta sp.]
LTNLIGNAVKFTERGNIDIRVEKRGISNSSVEIEVQVHDTGIGIAEKQQSQLFQAFRQADASISRRHGGTGLGLVITQKLVKEMGGTIAFHSRLGQGSTFWFHISLALNPNAASDPRALDGLRGKRIAYVEANPAAAQATLDILSSMPLKVSYSLTFEGITEAHYDMLLVGLPVNLSTDNVLSQAFINSLTTRADSVILALPSQMLLQAELLKTRGIAACLSKPVTRTRLLPVLLDLHARKLYDLPSRARLPLSVMAVDDNPANLKLIGALLEEQVENIVLCDSGEKAIAVAREQALDIILMDIQMPEIDGIRASEQIRELPQHTNTPIIAVTAHAIDGEREHLIKAGMNDYLAKPIDEVKLSHLLARYSPTLPASAPETPTISPSLDWQLALRQAANKPDLARDLLRMLLDFLPEVREKVEQSLAENRQNGLREIIHKLHGSASYSGVPRMKQLCLQIEHNLRLDGDVTALEPELLELLDEMDNVAREARHLLSQE